MIFKGIDFVTISSNNHASPTGALPFLLPASSSKNPGEAVLPVPSTRIERWIRERNHDKERTGGPSDEGWDERNQHAVTSASTTQTFKSKGSLDVRYEAYMSLLNYRIRNAYVSLCFSFTEPLITSMWLSSIRFTLLLQTSQASSVPSTSILVLQTPLLASLFPINYAPPPRPSFSNNHRSWM